MAEGFANHYGSDVLVATSAGLSPMPGIVKSTVEAMDEVGVDISAHIPSWYEPTLAAKCDIVVNMSGYRLPGKAPKQVVEWKVEDPYMKPRSAYQRVRTDIEQKVMQLILGLRRGK
ncbi:MAG: arsenate reductase ArsC [Acidobacteriia bacterium]|jgi:arsenate reductase|nr:arsenate reductase ArsC [Terriglobia bacterium]